MARQKKVDEYLKNQFILYYTLRYLWKLNGHTVGDLYKILFPSKNAIGGNKTLYDNILRGKVPYETMVAYSTKFEELTGLSKHYFTGQYELSITDLTSEDWHRFIQYRNSNEGTKSNEQKQIEYKIKQKIRDKKENKSPSSEPLRRLIYFAEYKQKRADKTLEDLFIEIERKIGECSPNDFEKADLQLLENHQRVIQGHLYNIAAIITVRKWKEKTAKTDN